MQSVGKLCVVAFAGPLHHQIIPPTHVYAALEMSLNETAFLEPRGVNRFGLRWFTPTDEVDLCGHATLASSHALWADGHVAAGESITFETRSGLLHATTRDGWIELDFPSEAGKREVYRGDSDHDLVAQSIGLEPFQLSFVGRNRMDVLVEVEAALFHNIKPNFGVMKAVPNCRVLSVTCSADARSDVDFFARSFAPAVGVDEDPVCGSAHCYMGKKLNLTDCAPVM